MQVRQTGPALITVHHHSIRSHADTSLQCTHEYNNINSERTTSLELASWHTLTDAFHIFIDTNELHCAYNTSYNKQWRQDTKRNCQNKHCSLTWRSRRRSPGLGLWHDCMYKQPGLLPSSASLIETNMSTTHASLIEVTQKASNNAIVNRQETDQRRAHTYASQLQRRRAHTQDFISIHIINIPKYNMLLEHHRNTEYRHLRRTSVSTVTTTQQVFHNDTTSF